jgi:hypothetical protein
VGEIGKTTLGDTFGDVVAVSSIVPCDSPDVYALLTVNVQDVKFAIKEIITNDLKNFSINYLT